MSNNHWGNSWNCHLDEPWWGRLVSAPCGIGWGFLGDPLLRWLTCVAGKLVQAVNWELSGHRRLRISVPSPLGPLYRLYNGWVPKLKDPRDKTCNLPLSWGQDLKTAPAAHPLYPIGKPTSETRFNGKTQTPSLYERSIKELGTME